MPKNKPQLIDKNLIPLIHNIADLFNKNLFSQCISTAEYINTINPNIFDVNFILANAYFEVGSLEKTDILIKQLKKINKNEKRILNLEIKIHIKLKQFDLALKKLDVSLKKNRLDLDLNLLKILILTEQNKFDDALDICNILAQSNELSIIYFNKAVILTYQKKYDEALQNYSKAILLDPKNIGAYLNKSVLLRNLNDFQGALLNYEEALKYNQSYSIYYNRANLLEDIDRFAEAIENYKNAILLNPNFSFAHANKGNAHLKIGDVNECINLQDQAIRLDPNDYDAYYTKGTALLLTGNLLDGFKLYENRIKKRIDTVVIKKFDVPVWDGNLNLKNKLILVHHEQGLGDTIQFSRYIKLLNELGAQVQFAPQKALKQLMKGLNAEFQLIDVNGQFSNADYSIPLLSLPFAFKTDINSIPSFSSYLKAEQKKVEYWKSKIKNENFKIGICWKGSDAKIDKGRSFSLSYFKNISNFKNVRLISLHKGSGEIEIQNLASEIKVETLGKEFDANGDAFIDAAAVMENLDLIITSDTAIAHLAGALGCPTWTLLKYVPDWRWMLHRSDSPWYPTMKLFRQRNIGDWSGVFREVEDELSRLIQSRNF